MKLLITGGCGFIGSNFIKYLSEKTDFKIINLDLGEGHYAGKGKNLEHMGLNKNYSFVQGDISNYKFVEQIFKKNNIDAVVNFAAESHVDRSINNDYPFMKANLDGARVLLNIAKNHWGLEKFVQVSTDEVYGSLSENAKSSEENDLLKPSSAYSASKAGAEQWALAVFRTFGLPVCVTRSSNNYGPYQHPEKLIPLFITNLIEGEKVPVYGTGENIRDWIHVEDNCKGIFKVLTDGKQGEIYNISGGNEKSNLEITKIILKELGFGEKMIEFVEDRKGHDLRYSLGCDKIKRELGWEPKIDFADGIKQTIEWYKKNENWWKRLKCKKKKFWF